MTARARNGRFTAERTTETTTTQRVTDRVSYAGTDTDTLTVQVYDPAADWALGKADWAEGAIEGEIHHAPGWDPGPIHPAALWNAQRRAQAQQALEHLLMAAESVPPGEAVPEAVVREAVTILRAGPGASRMELHHRPERVMLALALYAVAFVGGLVLDATVLHVARTRPMVGVCWYGFWTVACTVLAALEAALGGWGWVAWMAFCAANAAWRCRQFWNRRKRKRAAALAGAKSRARIAALVAKARQAARPRRVLRPVPGRSV